MNVGESVDEYLVAARQVGLSERTVEQYRWHLARLVGALSDAGTARLEDLSRSELRRWGAEIRSGWGPATCKQAVGAVRAWLRFCAGEGWCSPDLVGALAVPRVPKRLQRCLSVAETRQLLAACDPGTVLGRRDAALVSLLVDSGLRASEVCRLRLADLDVLAGRLQVVIKGGNEALGFFGQVTGQRLRAWVDVRAAAQGVGTVFVAVGGLHPGCALTRDGLRSVLRRLGERAGVERVSAHAFRRSFATMLIAGGVPTRSVQILGRWSNVQMVEQYSRALEAAELGGQYSAVDWLSER